VLLRRVRQLLDREETRMGTENLVRPACDNA
jgi:hypothetical protein